MNIRIAKQEDVLDIEPIGLEFFEESGYPGSLDFEAWRLQWQTLIELGAGYILLLEDDGKVVGFLSALVMPDPFNGVHMAAETCWFVSKSHRQGLAPIRLIREFETEARKRGCERALMSHLTKLTPERLGRLFEKRGYSLHEQVFIKELK